MFETLKIGLMSNSSGRSMTCLVVYLQNFRWPNFLLVLFVVGTLGNHFFLRYTITCSPTWKILSFLFLTASMFLHCRQLWWQILILFHKFFNIYKFITHALVCFLILVNIETFGLYVLVFFWFPHIMIFLVINCIYIMDHWSTVTPFGNNLLLLWARPSFPCT